MKALDILLNIFILVAFLTIGIVGISPTAQSQAPSFLSVIDDLPLMRGLREDADVALSFDTANGRIVETMASGPVGAGAVIDYYTQTLPQLGWKFETLGRYIREDEVLNIDVAKMYGDKLQVMVHFRLFPAGSK